MKGALYCPTCACDTIPNSAGYCCWCDTRLFTPPALCACGARALPKSTRCYLCKTRDQEAGIRRPLGRPRRKAAA